MTSKIKVNILADGGDNSIITSDGAGAVTFGTSGNSITIPSGVTITNNGTQTGFGGVNTPAFKVVMSASQSIPNDTSTKLQFNSEEFDTDSAFDTGTYRFTVPSGGAGKYYITVMIRSGSITDTKKLELYLFKNGASLNAEFCQTASSNSGEQYSLTLSTILDLSESDYLEVYTLHQSGSSVSFATLGHVFGGYKLIGA